MIRLLAALGLGTLLWLTPGAATAQLSVEGQCPAASRPLVAYAAEQLSITATPVGLTQSVYAPQTGAFKGAVPLVAAVTVVAGALLGPVTALDTGATVTPNLGIDYFMGQRFWICGRSISSVQLVATRQKTAIIKVIYYQ